MNKKDMKKWIPKNTSYCNECKWWHFLGTKRLDKENCEFANKCEVCIGCKVKIVRCDYLGITDQREDTLLWDGIKECGEHCDY